MTAIAEDIDFDAVFDEIVADLRKDNDRRLIPPKMSLFDGDFVLAGEIHREISAKFTLPENETGTGVVELPAQYYLARWLTDVYGRSKKNVIIVVEKDGGQWSGFLDDLEQFKDPETGQRIVRAHFLSDYEHLKHILVYCNPFLPPEFQFPRVYIMGPLPARFALTLTLFLQLLRLEGSLWTLPDNPLDPSQWINLDQSTWSQVVEPVDLFADSSTICIVHSRFKYMHDVQKRITDDAQLTWQPRRHMPGDPPPWPGANVKPGAIVWKLVDNSAWNTETSFGGSVWTGLVRAFTEIGSDGYTEGVDIIDDPTFPSEYGQSGYWGTNPRAPHIILRDGDHTAITSNSFHYKPPSDVGFVAGGHSAYGVNEMISAAINMAGDFISAIIPVGAPPLGGAADALAKPLYTDVVLSWQKIKLIGRAQELGWSHLHETLCGGSDRAYWVNALIALRTGIWRTSEKTTHTVTVVDGAEGLRIGQNGKGNAWLGTRIGTTVKDWGEPGRVYVDRISELVLEWSRDKAVAWTITVGHRDPEDPVQKAIEMAQELFSITRDLGVL
ncbi:phage tail protein [Nocardia sp. BSTN01]|uniref:Gp37-like protein n=1 Tax=Nocardia sp. BSTN01 TaxID=2783665 RepID=UPI0018906784|nr:phage tail protein [Nocardia sp. BSTN01]MBF5002215.1 phage tail protein [Nocardia sp. BSTN01]